MKAKRILFWVPDPTAFNSGGNLYNLQLINALKAKGKSVKWVTGAALKYLEASDLLLVDTLYLDQLDVLPIGVPKVLIVHHLESLFPPPGWQSSDYFLKFEKEKLQQFEGFLCTSTFTSNYLLSNGLTRQACFVVPPAIGFEPVLNEVDQSQIRALLVANWVERKGILPFLQELATWENGPWLDQICITLIGGFELEPEYAKNCLQLIRDSPALSTILDVRGELPHAETLKAYQKANLFISTSFMETYGMAIQEALAFDLPLLALRGGHVANHFVNRKNVLLFENMKDLVEELQRCCRFPKQWHQFRKEAKTSNLGKPRDWAVAAEELLQQLKSNSF